MSHTAARIMTPGLYLLASNANQFLDSKQISPTSTATAMMGIAEPSFPFLDLPAELRNHIYFDVLVSDKAIDLPESAPLITEPPLLVAGKQTRTEALAAYYGANVFQGPNHTVARRFVKQIHSYRASSIRCLHTILESEVWEFMDELNADGEY
jgi:hypothetical protein